MDATRTAEFCERFSKIHRELGVTWICEIHCQTVYDKPDLIRSMVDADMVGAQIGLESGDDTILKRFNKRTTSEMIFQTVNNCKKAGLHSLEGNILLGGAGETKGQLESNLDFAEQLIIAGKGMFDLRLAVFWPFPKTPITLNPSEYGVKIIPEQCENTIYSLGNFVSESAYVKRQEFIEHYYCLSEKINKIYRTVALQMTAKEAKKFWLQGKFDVRTKWGEALDTYKHVSYHN